MVNTKICISSSKHTHRHKKSVEPLPNAIGDYHISPTNRQCSTPMLAYKRNPPISRFRIALFAVNVVVRWRLGYNM